MPNASTFLVKTIADASFDDFSYEVAAALPLDGDLANMQVGQPAGVTLRDGPGAGIHPDPGPAQRCDGVRVDVEQNRDSPISIVDPRRNTPAARRAGDEPGQHGFLARRRELASMSSAPISIPSTPDDDFRFNSALAYPSRTNTQSAVNAYFHFRELIRRLIQYGFPMPGYFKFVTTPLKVKYRGGILPGARGGRTINAQVRWRIRPADIDGNRYARDQPRARGPRLSPRRAPLGIACDPRWLWHEFGHVLLAGATGELEFRFAHSAGDAMGAILHDPESKLAMLPRGEASHFHGSASRTGVTIASPRTAGVGPEPSMAASATSRPTSPIAAATGPSSCCPAACSACTACWAATRLTAGGRGQTRAPRGRRSRAVPHHQGDAAAGSASGAPRRCRREFRHRIARRRRRHVGARGCACRAANPRLGGLAQKVIRWAFEQQGAFPDPAQPFRTTDPEYPEVDIYIDSGPPPHGAAAMSPSIFSTMPGTRDRALWVQRTRPAWASTKRR